MWINSRIFTLVLALASLSLPAQGQVSEPADASGTATTPHCFILVSSPEQPKTRGNRPVFSAKEILDVEFHVLLPRAIEGERLMELKVYTPRGHLYQSLTVPFSATQQPDDPSVGSSARQVRTRNVSSYPLPLREQEMTPVRYRGRRFARVTARLPVAGTSITNSSLYGQWSVEAYLEGGSDACGPRRGFSIIE